MKITLNDKHEYIAEDGHKFAISVTEFVECFFEEFDSDAISLKTAEKECKTQEQVKAEWKHNADFGTKIHNYAEKLAIGKMLDNVFKSEAHEEFINATEEERPYYVGVNNALKNTIPIATEYIISNREFNIAGSVDLLCIDGTHKIKDYKVTKTLDKNNYGKFGLGVCKYISASKVNKYELQLSIYRYLFELEGIFINHKQLELIHIHPQYELGYKEIPVGYKRAIVKKMFEMWKYVGFDKQKLKELNRKNKNRKVYKQVDINNTTSEVENMIRVNAPQWGMCFNRAHEEYLYNLREGRMNENDYDEAIIKRTNQLYDLVQKGIADKEKELNEKMELDL